MMVSAAVMLGLGLAMTFAPRELLAYTGSAATPLGTLVVQVAGGLYLGFAMLNWMAKENLIGGIYGRPVALGNFLHFFIVAAALVRAEAGVHRQGAMLVGAIVYVPLAAWFGVVTFTSPVGKKAA